MMDPKFVYIPLGLINSNPLNPRKTFEGKKFDELVASVQQKGVIEPIIVRPVKRTPPYEIVAGERRFRAAGIVKLEAIPALVRELTDDEAYDFMLIENLQREDLTELEEAESFKAYAARHGEGAVQDIAGKTGIRPQYIRGRIHVLTLPANILEAWRKGDLHYAHLEQFLRLPDKNALKEIFTQVKRDGMTAAELKQRINESRIPLDSARFTAKMKCDGCLSNSTVQQSLFGFDEGKTACLSPGCFKVNQAAWLKEHWLETEIAKKDRTRDFRFDQDTNWQQREVFYGYDGVKPAKKCLECVSFVTLIEITGARRKHEDSIVCVGDKKCFRGVQAASRQTKRATDRSEKKKAVEAGNAPRVSWHGEYFRNLFFRKRVPEILEGLKPEDPKVKTLLVMCLAHANREAEAAVGKALGCRTGFDGVSDKALFSKLLALPYAKIAPIFQAVVEAVFLEGGNVGDYGGFGSMKRRLVADFLGVNLVKEFSVSQEYLEKKTKNELVAFGKKSGIFKDAKVTAYLAGKKRMPGYFKGSFEGLKKSELIDVFLKSGVELVGRVPDEITKA